MEKILFFESQGVLGPCQREEMPLAGTAAMLFTRRHSGFVTGSSKREHTQYMAQGAKLTTLPNLSHFASLQAPDEYSRSVLDFIDAK
jgi:pimeloyl-ACP methyl ester carboxylesterase